MLGWDPSLLAKIQTICMQAISAVIATTYLALKCMFIEYNTILFLLEEEH